jgi:hypothetical protein
VATSCRRTRDLPVLATVGPPPRNAGRKGWTCGRPPTVVEAPLNWLDGLGHAFLAIIVTAGCQPQAVRPLQHPAARLLTAVASSC